MKSKLLIGTGVVAALLLIAYIINRPTEVVAPVVDPSPSAETETAPLTDATGSPAETTESVPTKSAPARTSVSSPTAPAAKTTATTPPLPYTAVVVYNGERFIPDKITVIEGGTVRFVNTSDTKMWIASDNHPTHTRYPIKSETDCAGSSFDQCAEVGNGGSWSFTFTRTGTWGYHNHMRAQDTGDIVVRTKEEYLKTR